MVDLRDRTRETGFWHLKAQRHEGGIEGCYDTVPQPGGCVNWRHLARLLKYRSTGAVVALYKEVQSI